MKIQHENNALSRFTPSLCHISCVSLLSRSGSSASPAEVEAAGSTVALGNLLVQAALLVPPSSETTCTCHQAAGVVLCATPAARAPREMQQWRNGISRCRMARTSSWEAGCRSGTSTPFPRFVHLIMNVMGGACRSGKSTRCKEQCTVYGLSFRAVREGKAHSSTAWQTRKNRKNEEKSVPENVCKLFEKGLYIPDLLYLTYYLYFQL